MKAEGRFLCECSLWVLHFYCYAFNRNFLLLAGSLAFLVGFLNRKGSCSVVQIRKSVVKRCKIILLHYTCLTRTLLVMNSKRHHVTVFGVNCFWISGTRDKNYLWTSKEASTSRFTLRNQTPTVNIGESVFIFFLERRVENDVKNSLSIPGCRQRLSLTVLVL